VAQLPPVLATAKIGPQVGATVPLVAGVDQTGTRRTLSSVSGPKGAMLVYFRSADRPYCKTQLVELQSRY
jgi:peroxiredoxin